MRCVIVSSEVIHILYSVEQCLKRITLHTTYCIYTKYFSMVDDDREQNRKTKILTIKNYKKKKSSQHFQKIIRSE